MTWHQRAACLGVDVEVFFPERGDAEGARTALAYCERCPADVREACLDAGLAQKDGILGGTTGRQRRDLRQVRGVARRCAWCRKQFRAHNVQQYVCSAECRRAQIADRALLSVDGDT